MICDSFLWGWTGSFYLSLVYQSALIFVCSSFHYEFTAWGLCGSGEACSWIWWLWVQRVLFPFFFAFFLLSSSVFFPSDQIDNQCQHAVVSSTLFSLSIISIAGMDMTGKEKKQTKIFCEHIQLLFLQECCMRLHRYLYHVGSCSPLCICVSRFVLSIPS